jgi:hypothetical protein
MARARIISSAQSRFFSLSKDHFFRGRQPATSAAPATHHYGFILRQCASTTELSLRFRRLFPTKDFRILEQRQPYENRTADAAFHRYHEPRVGESPWGSGFGHFLRNCSGLCEPSGFGEGQSDRLGQRDDSAARTDGKGVPREKGLAYAVDSNTPTGTAGMSDFAPTTELHSEGWIGEPHVAEPPQLSAWSPCRQT